MKFRESWTVCCNLFINVVSPKSSGKTPCSNLFLKPLEAIEEEAMKKYDTDKRNRRLDKKRRLNEGIEGHDDEDDETSVNGSGDGNDRSHMFHPMTRTVTSVTPEALIEVLRYSKGNIVIKVDEFMVCTLNKQQL